LNKKAKGEILGILYRFLRFSPKVCCGGGKKKEYQKSARKLTPQMELVWVINARVVMEKRGIRREWDW
jgi:hypothetical protein